MFLNSWGCPPACPKHPPAWLKLTRIQLQEVVQRKRQAARQEPGFSREIEERSDMVRKLRNDGHFRTIVLEEK